MLHSDDLRRSSPTTPAPNCPVSSETGGDTASIQNRSEAAITAHNNALHPATIAKYRIKALRSSIPGQGDPREECGKFVCRVFSESMGLVEKRFQSCFRSECSRCWKSWANREKNRIVTRLFGYQRAAKPVKGHRGQRMINFMLSPVPEYAREKLKEEDGRAELRKEAYKHLDSLGINGGVVIPHEYRITKFGGIAEELKEKSKERHKGFWALIVENALNLNSFRDYVEVSPHYHGFGVTFKTHNEIKKSVKAFNEKTGWVFKEMGKHVYEKKMEWVYVNGKRILKEVDGAKVYVKDAEGKRVVKRDYLTPLRQIDVERAAFYFLSHAAIIRGRQSVYWFGCMSTRNLKVVNKKVTEVPQFHPVDGSPLFIETIETGVIERYVEKVETVYYKIIGVKDPPEEYTFLAEFTPNLGDE